MKIYKKLLSLLLTIVLVSCCLPYYAYGKTAESATKTVANIVLFGYFSNDTQDDANTYFNNNVGKMIDIIDGSSGRSFKNYIDAISYGQLKIENIFPQQNGNTINATKLNMTESDAKSNDYDNQIIETLVNSAPSIADKTVDYDGDGIADNVMIILKTTDTYSDVQSGASLIAHRGKYDGNAKINSKSIFNFNLFGTDRVLFEETGLVAHEFLHTLGYADLYRDTGSDNPVFTWSIMGGVSKYPQYPLAYERMYFSNWININEITKSQSLTLDTQDNKDGNQAFILKSPLNDHEIFVVEYRVRPERNYTETDSLDYQVGGTGIIVYRVNLNVEGLTNMGNKTGIYVFRPQDGQPGYSSYERTSVNNAYLPYSSTDGKRDSIGSADMSSTLADGALTFSDGSNSGIVINGASISSDGKQAKCDVSIPQKDDYDLWQNLNYSNSSSEDIRTVSIATVENDLYSVAFDDGKIVSKKYSNNQWSEFSQSINDSNVTNINLQQLGDNLYLAYYDMDSSYNEYIKLYKYNTKTGGNWSLITSISNAAAGVDIGVVNNELYLTYLTYATNGWNSDINVAKLSGDTLQNIGVCDSAMVGQPKIVSLNNKLYICYRNANGNIVTMKEYDGTNFVKVSDDTLKASYYDVVSDENKIYIALGGGNLKITDYDGANWSSVSSSSIQCGEPGLTVVSGNLFALTSPQEENGKLRMYHFYNGEFTQEGEDIDSSASDITIRAINKDIYLSYVLLSNTSIVIKSKTAKQAIVLPDKEVDKSALDAALIRANIHIKDNYSSESISKLNSLIDKYSPLLNSETTQKEVDFATKEILEATYGLKPLLNLNISALNGLFSVSYDDINNNDNSYSILSGTKISLNATPNNGYTFVGWYDSISGRFLSNNSSYSFVISANINLEAVFIKEQSATLTFANYSGFVQSSVSKTVAQWNDVSSIKNLLPSVPNRYGYTNGRWVYNDEDVLASLRVGENVTLIPQYDVVDTSLPTPPEATDKPVLDLYFKMNDNNVGSFVMAVGIPDNCTIDSIGVAFYYKKAAEFDPTDNFELLLNNKMLVSRFNTDVMEDIYIVNVNKFYSTYNWAARGYISYYDENNNYKIVYSNQINVVNSKQV